ncbi:MAG: MsnO8 family LLM class oxidoreductase [Thermomicrobiales bacterium]
MIPLSLHDRSHLTTDTDSRAAFLRTIDRAQRAEALGYSRFWTAEHHGVPGVAGSAPAVLLVAIGHATSRIRIGAGGVMLPNHQPLVVAEQFAMLEALFPGRADLGLGRSLGFVRPVREALRREQYTVEDMADDIAELTSYLLGTSPVTLMPAVAPVPMFVLATGRGA